MDIRNDSQSQSGYWWSQHLITEARVATSTISAQYDWGTLGNPFRPCFTSRKPTLFGVRCSSHWCLHTDTLNEEHMSSCSISADHGTINTSRHQFVQLKTWCQTDPHIVCRMITYALTKITRNKLWENPKFSPSSYRLIRGFFRFICIDKIIYMFEADFVASWLTFASFSVVGDLLAVSRSWTGWHNTSPTKL